MYTHRGRGKSVPVSVIGNLIGKIPYDGMKGGTGHAHPAPAPRRRNLATTGMSFP